MMTRQHPTSGAMLALLLIYGLMAAFCWHTPLMADDFVFLNRLPSAADILPRAVEQYHVWDGRFTGYLLGFTILKLPHAVYVAVASAIFCGLVPTILVAAFGPAWREHFTPGSVLLIAALLWIGIPAFGSVFFWKTGLYYGAAVLMALWFMIPYRLVETFDTHPLLRSPLTITVFGVLALFTGMSDYLIPILCSLFAFTVTACTLLWEKRSPTARRIYYVGLAGILIGTCITLFAPGNTVRMASSEATFFALPLLERMLNVLVSYKKIVVWFSVPFALMAWGLWCWFQRFGRKAFLHVPPWACFYALTALAGHAAYLFVPQTPSRVFTFIAALWIVTALIMQDSARRFASPKALCVRTTLLAGVALYALVTIPLELQRFRLAHAGHEERIRLLSSANGQPVCLSPLPVQGSRYLPAGRDLDDIPHNADHWVNRAIADLWQVPSVSLCVPPNTYRRYETTTGTVLVEAHFADARLRLKDESNNDTATIKLFYPSRSLIQLDSVVQAWLTDNLIHPEGLRRYLVPIFYRNKSVPLARNEAHAMTGEFGLFPFPPASLPLYVLPPNQDDSNDYMPLFVQKGAEEAPRP